MLRRIGTVIIVALVPLGAAGFAAVIAGPENTEVDSVLPPRYRITDFDGTMTYGAWLTLLVACGWTIALLRGSGPWNDAGRACLLLALAVGLLWTVGEVGFIVLFYAILIGGIVVLVAMRRHPLVIAATGLWLLAGWFGWAFTTPDGWVVLLVMPAVWPVGALVTRGRRAGSPPPTR